MSNNSNRPTHIIYNTGDEIWLTYQGEETIVVKIKTHDGIEWEIGQPSLWDNTPIAGGGD
jgi:hypothetical protein